MSEPQSGAMGKLQVSGASFVGGMIGFVVFKYLKHVGVTIDAGEESIVGTGFGVLLVWIWWLFEPRIKRWRNAR